MEKGESSNPLDFDSEGISDKFLERMNNEAIERVKRELPNLPQHMQEIQKSRGAGLESAIMCEQVLNSILEYMDCDKETIITLTFGKKINKMIEILERDLKRDEWLKETIENLKKIKCLRNIYAHVPGDYKSRKLRFDPSEEYYKEEEQEFRLKPLRELNDTFADLDEDLQERMLGILKKLVPIREKQKQLIEGNE